MSNMWLETPMTERFNDFIQWIRSLQVGGAYTTNLVWSPNGDARVPTSTPLEKRTWYLPVKISEDEAVWLANELDLTLQRQ